MGGTRGQGSASSILIDPDLFEIFVRERVYLRYEKQFLEPSQIDDVDVSRIPGYPGDWDDQLASAGLDSLRRTAMLVLKT